MRTRRIEGKRDLTLSSLVLASSIWLAFAPLAKADTNATWSGATGGNWTTAADWSTNPNYPNNGTPSGTNYTATISTGSPYVLQLNSNVTIDGLTINSSSASQLDQSAGTFQAGTISITAGSYYFTGGTLLDTNVSTTNNGFNVFGGTLNGDTFNGTMTWNGTMKVQNGLSASGGTMNVVPGTTVIYADAASQTFSNVSILPLEQSGSQAIIYPSGPDSTGAQTLTLASTASVDDGIQFANDHTGDTLLNNGKMTTNTLDETYGLQIDTSNFTNNGSVTQTGEQLFINCAGTITNNSTGVINLEQGLGSITGGTINNSGLIEYDGGGLSGNITNTGTIGGFDEYRNFSISGSVANSGTFDLTGGSGSTSETLSSFSSTGGSVVWEGFAMTGGTTISGGSFEASGSLTGNLTLSTSAPTYLANISGTTAESQYDQLAVDGNTTLSGDLAVTFSFFTPTHSETFTILSVNGAGHTLVGSFANVSNGGELLVNNGADEFQVFYGSGAFADEVVLENFQAVPEPASLALLLGGAGFGLLRRRRPRTVIA